MYPSRLWMHVSLLLLPRHVHWNRAAKATTRVRYVTLCTQKRKSKYEWRWKKERKEEREKKEKKWKESIIFTNLHLCNFLFSFFICICFLDFLFFLFFFFIYIFIFIIMPFYFFLFLHSFSMTTWRIYTSRVSHLNPWLFDQFTACDMAWGERERDKMRNCARYRQCVYCFLSCYTNKHTPTRVFTYIYRDSRIQMPHPVNGYTTFVLFAPELSSLFHLFIVVGRQKKK